MQQKFFKLIEQENKKGVTVLFSSHILSEVQQLCNRVAIIKDGEIISVQDIKTLQKDSYKKFSITGKNLNDGKFEIDGVTQLIQKDEHVSFFFKGDINQIIEIMSTLKLKDISIEEPTLEEIFMHYYE
jgi:beta-exotoxin I transport system ATP-binding protein